MPQKSKAPPLKSKEDAQKLLDNLIFDESTKSWTAVSGIAQPYLINFQISKKRYWQYRRLAISRIVYIAHSGYTKLQLLHIDGNPLNDDISNLIPIKSRYSDDYIEYYRNRIYIKTPKGLGINKGYVYSFKVDIKNRGIPKAIIERCHNMVNYMYVNIGLPPPYKIAKMNKVILRQEYRDIIDKALELQH